MSNPGEFNNTPEAQRQERLRQIDSGLDRLTKEQNDAIDWEDMEKRDEIQASIEELKKEQYDLMTDKERVSIFEDKLDDHREIAEMGIPVSIETIAEDAWGQMPASASPYLESELSRIRQENDFIEGE